MKYYIKAIPAAIVIFVIMVLFVIVVLGVAAYDAFIEKLDGEWQAGLSFETNLEEFFKLNRVRKQTKEICYKAIDT